jgi:hypothetical protein
MSNKQNRSRVTAPDSEAEPRTRAPKVTRADTLIALMRSEAGATAPELAAAVGWQVHSIRGFIAGTLKKRADLNVTATREDGVTRYRVVAA